MSDIYVRGRGRRPSGILLITFLLGVAIGFSSAYVVMRGRTGAAPAPAAPAVSQPAPAIPPAVPPPSPKEVAANTPVQSVETPPASDAVVPVPGADELWPGRFLFVGVDGTTLSDTAKALLKEVHPMGVVLQAANIGDPEQTTALVADIKRAAGFGGALGDLPLIAIEQEGGSVNPLKIDPAPSAADMGHNKDIKGARELGRICAQTAIGRGIGVILAPVLDVAPGDAPVPDAETRLYGTDQEQVALLGLAFADGLAAGGAISVAKAYPGIGKARKTDNEERLVLDYELSRLAELMYPFDEAVRQGIAGILVGHVAVPALDQQFPKRPASVSPVLVKKVLRDYWNFANVILADNVASSDMERSRPAERAAAEALMAGCDAVLFLDVRPERIRAACNAIQEAMQTNALSHDELVKSRDRLQQWQERLRTVQSAKPVEAVKPAEPVAPVEPAKPAEPAAVPPPQSSAEPAALPAAANSGAAAPAGEKSTHVVEKGESLEKIARHHGVKVKDLAAWNKLDGEKIKVGDTLVLYSGASAAAPPVTDATPVENTTKHTVQKGESLQKIASRYGTTVKKLLELNNMDRKDPLLAETEILVPKPKE